MCCVTGGLWRGCCVMGGLYRECYVMGVCVQSVM